MADNIQEEAIRSLIERDMLSKEAKEIVDRLGKNPRINNAMNRAVLDYLHDQVHRTNQQNVIRAMLDIVASYHKFAAYDARNADAVRISKRINDLIQGEGLGMSYI